MEKGDRTKLAIYNKAKELFAEKGYKGTTMREVTQALDLQPSWISYYFKQKSNIANEIILETVDRIFKRMDSAAGEIENPLLRRFVHMRLHYKVIVRDKANARFISEMSSIDDFVKVTRKRLEHSVAEIARYYGIEKSKEEIEFYTDMSLAAFYMVWQRYYEGTYSDLSEDSISLDPSKIFALLLGINSDALNTLAERSKEIADKIDVSDIKLLR